MKSMGVRLSYFQEDLEHMQQEKPVTPRAQLISALWWNCSIFLLEPADDGRYMQNQQTTYPRIS